MKRKSKTKRAKRSEFLPFKEAREFVRRIGLKNSSEWFEYCRLGKRPRYIPAHPCCFYGSEWTDWYDWLGTGKIKYWPFQKARIFVRKLGLKNTDEWRRYCRSGKNKNLPSNPNRNYKKEWKSWMDWLNTKNLPLFPKKHKVNNDYFKKWTHNMAYVLGFWFTDGNINRENNGFSIYQHKISKYLLEQIKREMHSTYPLYYYRNGFVFYVYSKTIIKDILRLGGKYNKSLTSEFPDVPKKYLPDFIRGLWDGDGSIFYIKKQKSYGSSFCCGSERFVRKMYKCLKDNIPLLSGSIQIYSPKEKIYIMGILVKTSHPIYSIVFSKNDTIRLGKYMYNGGNCGLKLNRKYKKFQGLGDIVPATKDYSFWTFSKARRFAISLGLKSKKEWYVYYKNKSVKILVPHNPEKHYKKQWVDWFDWLGIERDFLSFKEARQIVRRAHLEGYHQYLQWLRADYSKNIPSAPSMVYKTKWIDWYNWLGKVHSQKLRA